MLSSSSKKVATKRRCFLEARRDARESFFVCFRFFEKKLKSKEQRASASFVFAAACSPLCRSLSLSLSLDQKKRKSPCRAACFFTLSSKKSVFPDLRTTTQKYTARSSIGERINNGRGLFKRRRDESAADFGLARRRTKNKVYTQKIGFL